MLDWLYSWLQAFILWLISLVKALFVAAWDFLKDLMVWVIDEILKVMLWLIQQLPVPDFLSSYSLGSLIGGLPSEVGWFVAHMRLGEALALLAAGASFRLLRKLMTLGQW